MKETNKFVQEFMTNHPSPDENNIEFSDTIEGTYGEVCVLPTNSLGAVMTFCETHKSFVYKFMLPLLEHGVEKDLDTIEYLAIGTTGMMLTIDRDDIIKSLDEVMEYFIENEEYEYAVIARDIKNKFYINQLLESI